MPAPRGAATNGSVRADSRPTGLVEHLAEVAGTKRPVNSFVGISKYYTSAELLLRQVRASL